MTDAHRGKLVFSTRREEGFFEVFETGATDGFPFTAYCNGTVSVRGSDAITTVIALQRKHLVGLPDGKLIDFKTACEKLKDGH